MPYSRNINFEPSTKFKNAWTAVPQNIVLSIDNNNVGSKIKTRSMYDIFSPLIKVYYLLALLAISFDIYIGFSVLSRYGVTLMFIIGAVIADFLFVVLPYLFKFKPIQKENNIFRLELERITRRKNEEDTLFVKRSEGIESTLKKSKSKKNMYIFFRYLLYLGVFGIAVWKILMYLNVLPPNTNIFSNLNGKKVIIFSVLTAVFHIIATEKAYAHFIFWNIKNKEIKKVNPSSSRIQQTQQIAYEGVYNPSKYKNTELVIDKEGKAKINYYGVIWDDEIQHLMNQQSDESAKRGVAIACKTAQIIDKT